MINTYQSLSMSGASEGIKTEATALPVVMVMTMLISILARRVEMSMLALSWPCSLDEVALMGGCGLSASWV
jgi:hypothetical protein